MKIKKYIFITLFLTSLLSFSQESKSIDFFKTLDINISELQDYMLSVGYEFYKTDKDEYGDKYTWTLNKDRYDKADKFFSLYMNFDKTKEFSNQTNKKDEYLAFKKLIKKNNLNFKKIENIDGALVEFYENSKYLSKIFSYTDKQTGTSTYELNLLKKEI